MSKLLWIALWSRTYCGMKSKLAGWIGPKTQWYLLRLNTNCFRLVKLLSCLCLEWRSLKFACSRWNRFPRWRNTNNFYGVFILPACPLKEPILWCWTGCLNWIYTLIRVIMSGECENSAVLFQYSFIEKAHRRKSISPRWRKKKELLNCPFRF